MSRVKALAAAAAGATMVASAIVGVATPAGAAASYRLYVSTHSNRSHAVPLTAHTIKGTRVYIFVKPSKGANAVKFYLNDTKRKHAYLHKETAAPYDLMGGDPNKPTAWNTTLVRNGRNTLTIEVDLPNKKKVISTATFTIRNIPPPPKLLSVKAGQGKVALAWKSGHGITSSFAIYRSTHKPVSLRKPIKLVNKTTTHWTDKAVKAGTRYYYVVRSVSAGHGYASSATMRTGTVTAAPFGVTWSTSSAGDGTASLTWTAQGGKEVDIYRSTSTVTATPANLVKKLTTASTSYPDIGLTDGTTYQYLLVLIDGTKHAQSLVLQLTPVAAPTDVSATGNGGTVTVTWQHSGTGVSAFTVFRFRSSSPATVDDTFQATSGSARSVNDTTNTAGVSYFYVVEAKSGHGGVTKSDPSTHVIPIDAPTGLQASSGDATAELTWNAGPSWVDTYYVYQSTSSSVGTILAHKVGSAGQTATSFDDTDLSNGTVFYYIVQAVSTTGEIANSGPIAVQPITSPILDMPSFNDADQVTLSWSASDEPPVTIYRIFRGKAPTVQTSGSPYDTVAAGVHTWSDTTTTNGTHYFYVVQAYFTGGHAESNTVNVTPNPPDGVANLVATPDAGQITLTWDKVTDTSVTGIQIYSSPDGTDGSWGDFLVQRGPNAKSYIDSPLNDGDVWYYRIRTISPGGFTDTIVGPVTVGAVGP